MEELRQIIQGFILRKPLIRRKFTAGKIFYLWSEIVGKEIADKSSPREISRGVLTVECESSVWANELSMMSKKIEEKINEEAGERVIKKILFRVIKRC